MGVASLVTELKDWLYLKSELMEWTDFFAFWCKFRKAKSNFNDFWVDMVKIGHGHLVHETLKSSEWVYELSLFLPADCDAIIFGKVNIVLYIFDF